MRSLQCLYNSRQALCRVFFPAQSPFLRAESATWVPLARPAVVTSSRVQRRTYAKRPTLAKAAVATFVDPDDIPYDPRFTTERSFAQSGKSRLPIDHEITDPQVMVVDVSGGAPEGPLDPKFILSRIDLTTESLRMVSPYVPANKEKKQPARFPLCKVVNKKDEVDRQRAAREKKKSKASPKTKDLELGWAITDHDLGFKMKQIAGFLGKGMMVNVLFGRKKGSKPVDQERCREVVDKVVEEAVSVGARERKKGDGVMGKAYKISLQGPEPKKEADPSSQGAE